MKVIALIQNDEAYLQFLKRILIEAGYKVITAKDEVALLKDMYNIDMDLVITCYGCKTITAQSFVKQFHKEFPKIPIVFIGNESDVQLISDVLKNPKVDFMIKPISTEEFLARVQVAMTPKENTVEGKSATVIGAKDLTMNTETLEVKRQNMAIVLTPTEFKLLHYLVVNKNKVLSREMILNHVWKTSYVNDRIVDVYIGYLREKVDYPFEFPLIQTVIGFGYKIED